MEKRCKKCGTVKPLEDFYRAKGARDGYRGECKACNAAASRARYVLDPAVAKARVRRWQQANPDRLNAYRRQRRSDPAVKRAERSAYLKRTYGLTLDEYEAMLKAQEGGCAICQRPPSESISLHVDHDHETGRIRGLLCFRCNNSLGDMEDSQDLLLAAAAYVGPPVGTREALLARLAGRTPAWA